jgi:tetratricopeptide (TPR) repeat protein
MRALLASAAVAVVVSMPAIACADDAALAEALFREGKALLDDGDYEQACPKLEESQRLDPGTGTLWHLARCYEDTNRLASAWSRYLELAALARKNGEAKKQKAAQKAADRIEPNLPTLTIAVAEGDRIDGLAITIDGRELGPGAWGTAAPIDAGSHEVEVTAQGHAPWTTSIDITEPRQRETIDVPRLVPVDEPEGDDDDDDDDGPATDGPSDGQPWHRDYAGWTLVAGGVLLVVGGAWSVGHAGSLDDEAAATLDLAERDDLFDSADRFRTLGTIFAVGGAAAIIAGAIKLAINPKPKRGDRAISTSILPRPGGMLVGLSGHF